MNTSPRAAAERAEHLSFPGPGRGERFAGYGVVGLPFDSGHYLALRRFPANPFGRPYHSVWHRDPDGTWVFYVDVPASESCPRYFDAAISGSSMADISITWTGPSRLTVEVGAVLVWNMELRTTTATALMNGASRLMPHAMWESRRVLEAMGKVATPVLGAGRVQLAGTAPNGQWFKASPRRIWDIADSAAVIHGVDVGTPGPLPEQARLGDMWLPQRGTFFAGEASFQELDPSVHQIARPARPADKAAMNRR